MLSVEKNEVGEKIRELRKKAGLTQYELARRTGIVQSDLSRMETGAYRVSVMALAKILDVLDIKVGEFFGESAPVDPVESALIGAFRSLDSDTRAVVIKKVNKRISQKIA